jgi:hypothetical protein
MKMKYLNYAIIMVFIIGPISAQVRKQFECSNSSSRELSPPIHIPRIVHNQTVRNPSIQSQILQRVDAPLIRLQAVS